MRSGTEQIGALPLQLRRSFFLVLTQEVGRQMEAKGLTEEEILKDFSRWKKARRRLRAQGSCS